MIIIGGGPAGVSAAVEFEKKGAERWGRSGYLLLEKPRLFNTLRNFAKCKPFFYPSTGEVNVSLRRRGLATASVLVAVGAYGQKEPTPS